MRKHTAFTMIELVFVIVIMGILGKFGVEFLAKAYNSFIFTKINNELQANSASAVEFIASRLQYRIKDSVIARRTLVGSAPEGLSAVDSTQDYVVLEWVGYDNDGYRGQVFNVAAGEYLPTWSGIIDLDASNANRLISPATNTVDINTTVGNLSNSTSSINDIALYCIGSINDIATDYGWDGNITKVNAQQGAMHPVTSNGVANQFVSSTGTNFTGVTIKEYYKIAWTAYALVNDGGTLRLIWNYQPWKGENYNSLGINRQSSIIMENVDTFRFKKVGDVMKIQVCVKTSLQETYSLCKEKTIF